MSDRQIPSYERMGIILESTLSGTEKFTLMTLNQFVDGHGECWPGNQRLARLMSADVSTIKRRIAALEAKGIVTRRRRFNADGSETSSVKRIDFEAIRSMASQKSTDTPPEPGGGAPARQGGRSSDTGGGAVAIRGGVTGDTGGGAPVRHDLSNRTDPEEQIQKNTHTHTQSEPPHPTARAGENLAGEGYGTSSPLVATEQRLRMGKALPRWRTGHGPNDYDPAVVEKLRTWLEGLTPGSRRMRADAIAYIRRRERSPGDGDWETLSERVAELMGDSSPTQPRPPAIDIASLAQSAIAAERGGAA